MKQTVNPRGGIYELTKEVELKAKLSTVNRRVEELEQRNHQEVRAVLRHLCIANHSSIANLPVIKGSIVQFRPQ